MRGMLRSMQETLSLFSFPERVLSDLHLDHLRAADLIETPKSSQPSRVSPERESKRIGAKTST